jgi:DNA polymerase-3 subunit epsilon
MSQTQLLALLILLLLLGVAALYWLRQRLRRPATLARRLASEVRTIAAANARHRLPAQDLPAGFDELAEAINALAARYERLLTTQSRAVTQARADLAAEHARLIALINNLAEGVLVCDPEGEILLYNPSARALLGEMVGLGRSLFGLLEPAPLEQALATIREQPRAAARVFVTRTVDGRFVRVRVSPVLDGEEVLQGFVLTLEDVTEQVQSSDRRDMLVAALGRDLRGGLANLRAAIETLRAYPDMDDALRRELEEVIAREAARLSDRVGEALAEYAGIVRACWHLEEMTLADLLQLLAQRIRVNAAPPPEDAGSAWVRVDSLALVRMLADVTTVVGHAPALSARLEEGHIRIDLSWPEGMADVADLRAALQAGGEGGPSPQEVAGYHGGEIWVQRDARRQGVQLVLLLPLIAAPETPAAPARTPAIEPRPEFYDFELLFRRPQPAPSLAETPLARLRYAVFDTETTGLDPDSDEIVALGAVRIVNARLLEHETFHHLVRPRRPVPPSATRIHGLRDDDLRDAPPLEEVLPLFARYVEGAVLVAHNAAFDMRFLQEAEGRTGVRFQQPVLDTLLLSAIVHPEHRDHSLEAIASRLGVSVQARHSALGDALTTARIFLKLIPLLEVRGVVTLAQAQAASEATYFARIRY